MTERVRVSKEGYPFVECAARCSLMPQEEPYKMAALRHFARVAMYFIIRVSWRDIKEWRTVVIARHVTQGYVSFRMYIFN